MSVGTVELVTMSEYARRRGCSEGAVRRAVKDKRISLIDGRVDPVAADAQWQRNTRVRAGSRSTNDANLQAPADAPAGRGADGGDGAGPDYWASKGRREAAEADLAELKLAELQGALVRADDVRASLAKRAAAFREGLLQIPARLSAQLAAETDQARVHALIDAELRAVMAGLVAEGA
jgi:hypothetical protein